MLTFFLLACGVEEGRKSLSISCSSLSSSSDEMSPRFLLLLAGLDFCLSRAVLTPSTVSSKSSSDSRACLFLRWAVVGSRLSVGGGRRESRRPSRACARIWARSSRSGKESSLEMRQFVSWNYNFGLANRDKLLASGKIMLFVIFVCISMNSFK